MFLCYAVFLVCFVFVLLLFVLCLSIFCCIGCFVVFRFWHLYLSYWAKKAKYLFFALYFLKKQFLKKLFRHTSVSNLGMRSDRILWDISLTLNMTKKRIWQKWLNTTKTSSEISIWQCKNSNHLSYLRAFKPEVSQRFCKQCKI